MSKDFEKPKSNNLIEGWRGTTEQIGEYKGLELWTSDDDYWVSKANIAVHSFGYSSRKNTIFVRKEAYVLLVTRPDLLDLVLEHEYQEYLAFKGEASRPPHEDSPDHQAVMTFLKDQGY